MAFDIGNQGRYVFYCGLRFVNDNATNETTPVSFAVAEQDFNFSNLIEDSSAYVLSVERFLCSSCGIPMFEKVGAAPFIGYRNKVDTTVLAVNPNVSFSLLEFMTQLDEEKIDATWSLTTSGRVQVSGTFWDENDLILSPQAAAMFDMPRVVPNPGAANENNIVVGASPIFDRFDQLFLLELQASTGLSGMQQEIVNTDIFRNTVTDFLVPGVFTMSVNANENDNFPIEYSLTFPVRQDIQFQTSENRRFIMLKGNNPIQNIRLEMFAQYRDGTRHRVIIPPNGVFDVKLAFWKKGA